MRRSTKSYFIYIVYTFSKINYIWYIACKSEATLQNYTILFCRLKSRGRYFIKIPIYYSPPTNICWISDDHRSLQIDHYVSRWVPVWFSKYLLWGPILIHNYCIWNTLWTFPSLLRLNYMFQCRTKLIYLGIYC